MKEPGLDNRHRDSAKPNDGKIDLKRGDTLNKNLDRPIKGFSPLTRLDTMRTETGEKSIANVREAAKKR